MSVLVHRITITKNFLAAPEAYRSRDHSSIIGII
jgi:hypothetical protein